MKERPILFSGPMVRALLDGTKTQTRRVVKHPLAVTAKRIHSYKKQTEFDCILSDESGGIIECPYGKPGDRLWVREKWQAWDCTSVMDKEWEPWDRERRSGLSINEYHAERGSPDGIEYAATSESMGPWTPSIHMPRWASRITLEITSVRVERLQDISAADAIAEGIESLTYGGQTSYRDYSLSDEWAEVSPMLESPIQSYRTLWNSINGPDAWDDNPWLWVVASHQIDAATSAAVSL